MTISTTTLKNAAFAIEHDLFTDPDGSHYLVKDGAILRRWEPEHDDGEALRLAMALGIGIHPDLAVSSVQSSFMIGPYGYNEFAEFEDYEDCPMFSVRMLIVLSAVRIGEFLKCQS
jgi:hypothetical protein